VTDRFQASIREALCPVLAGQLPNGSVPQHLSKQSKSFAAWQAISQKIRNIDGKYSEIHLALAAFAVSTHPSDDVAGAISICQALSARSTPKDA